MAEQPSLQVVEIDRAGGGLYAVERVDGRNLVIFADGHIRTAETRGLKNLRSTSIQTLYSKNTHQTSATPHKKSFTRPSIVNSRQLQ